MVTAQDTAFDLDRGKDHGIDSCTSGLCVLLSTHEKVWVLNVREKIGVISR